MFSKIIEIKICSFKDAKLQFKIVTCLKIAPIFLTSY
jgi:hypothetical protein